MSKQQKQILILVVMGIVLIGVLTYQMSSSKTPAASAKAGKSKAGQSAKNTSGAAEDATEASALKRTDIDIDVLLANIQEVDFEYDAEEIPRDPMRPLIGTLLTTEQEDPVIPPASVDRIRDKNVSGIVWNEHAPVAIVDNEIVVPGFVYPDGTEVESIGPDRVVFKVAESLIQVQLKEH